MHLNADFVFLLNIISLNQTNTFGKHKLTYLCTLVGSTELATIINLPSGSLFFIFYTLKVLFRIALSCFAIESVVPLINWTTLATPQHEELIHKPRKNFMLGENDVLISAQCITMHSIALPGRF